MYGSVSNAETQGSLINRLRLAAISCAIFLADRSRQHNRRLLALGHDARRLWAHPKSTPEFKKRILRTVLKEIIASSAGDTAHLVLHWQGGDHTELTLQKTRTRQHRYVISPIPVEGRKILIRKASH
jgi:hypothetical protein